MSISGKGRAVARTVKNQSGPLKVLEIVAMTAGAAAVLFLVVLGGDGREDPKFPAHGPAEFLYLDGSRVLAYLAQFDGGNFTTKQLTSKSSDTVNGKLTVQNAFELGETSQQEESISKEIKATAAGNYIELLAKLENLDKGLKTIGLGRFEREVSGLTEGQFVRFETHGLRPPIYLNPYLAVRQRETRATLFPLPPKGEPGRERVELQREKALRFRERLGDDPRVVFALRPLSARQLNGEKLSPEEKKNHVQYLIPMDARLLTRERSLIKFGGGAFTVVGKVVRIFPEDGDENSPAYIDSPTVETWQQPLAAAPPKLLCRTDPSCAEVLHEAKGRGEAESKNESAKRSKAIRQARGTAIKALEKQTRILVRGAVILPIAIYK